MHTPTPTPIPQVPQRRWRLRVPFVQREEKLPNLVWTGYVPAPEHRGAFDALWRACVAALAYLLALFGRRTVQEVDDDHLGSASINSHHEETPVEWIRTRRETPEWVLVTSASPAHTH
ncbi:hypothetical protein CC85DRAFT_288931 [Cutaneotrichosporon oleaginosum]|uniref:Uncharacterized protein n=1 Tax=Cutaneotrichosporon oleaginosum TaxID=879819 RepID=A0A0J1AUU9_9TREE|nr:uncharacterized protein CC85DRAFT_288931 [Cutaneotrichosporon oleaginosum]KLT39059.1 hypothetical protein CC85DRAFT_288931 [Cutaneotrichosporon oleaginosum]TXT11842.1 hypothetical protein COLE_02252 [Cutaneotrichosporon oleaginosum]